MREVIAELINAECQLTQEVRGVRVNERRHAHHETPLFRVTVRICRVVLRRRRGRCARGAVLLRDDVIEVRMLGTRLRLVRFGEREAERSIYRHAVGDDVIVRGMAVREVVRVQVDVGKAGIATHAQDLLMFSPFRCEIEKLETSE